MANETTATAELAANRVNVFARVLVGVDQSPASSDAARQAALLTDDKGRLTLLAAWTVPRRKLEPEGTTTMLAASSGGRPATFGVLGPSEADDEAARTRRKAAEHAAGVARMAVAGLAPCATKVVEGVAWEELIAEIERERATLVAVGTNERGRILGILRHSTPWKVVRKAPCAVLVARPAGEQFPRRLVVGVDGSSGSTAALAVARLIADRFQSELRTIVAHGGKSVDDERVAAMVGHPYASIRDEPVAALVAASADADLVIVGSRGVHGLRALRSVAERVAHQAQCSILIVRPAPQICA